MESNIRNIHLNTPDYKGIDAATAFKDFQKRRENYLNVYEPVDNSDGSHIKIINNETFIVYNVRGYLPQKVSSHDIFMRLINLQCMYVNFHYSRCYRSFTLS